MTSKFCALMLLASFQLMLAACDGNSADGETARSSGIIARSGTGTMLSTPTISGVPAGSVTVGTAYEFRPSATHAANRTLTFSIGNQPSWTQFDTATGALSGTPTGSQVGIYGNIEIGVSDGGPRVALAPFSIRVAAAAVTPTALTITGTPAGSVIVGAVYMFLPSTTAPAGSTLTFSIRNQPAWTTFDSATGALSGTPTGSEAATFANIEISVSDGGPSVVLAPFSITVAPAAAAVTLSWMAPQTNTNGTNLTNLSGYRIYYGTTATNLSQVVSVEGNVTTFVFNQLALGTWYFAVAAINGEQVESTLSAVVPFNTST